MMTVLEIIPIIRNTLAKILTKNNLINCIYPSAYEVLSSESLTESTDDWNQYVGKRILVSQHDREEDRTLGYPIQEYLVVATKGKYVMLYDVNTRDEVYGHQVIWRDTNDYDVLGTL